MSPPQVKGEKDSQALFRIASFIAAFLLCAFLTYHADDVEFAVAHNPQRLKNVTLALFLIGPSVYAMVAYSRSCNRWKMAASVVLGICLGSGIVTFCALSGIPMSVSYVIDSIR